ncbi:hypothetical protein BVX98_03915 [bacterium F11]|nr:hypothetical protein BVX98_03915 [bacterium F11]
MKTKILSILTVVFFMGTGLFVSSCKQQSHDGHKEHRMTDKKGYTCPMHPNVESEKEGRCPECNMFLVPKEGQEDKMEHHQGHDEHPPTKKSSGTPIFHCPMHPTFTSENKGECGICGMDLVPVELGEQRESLVPGQATVKIPERRQQMIGVKFGSVKKRSIVKVIRTIGRVAYDPELYRVQEEYLGVLSAYEKVKGSSLPEAKERAKSFVASSELRLRLLGLSQRQIRELANRSGPDTSLLISSGREGRVWLYADAYEYELPSIKVGQKVEATTVSLPGIFFNGTVKSIDSVINSKTRTARVRVEVFNKDGLLKPDMYLNAKIKIDQGEKLTVSEEAVMDTGTRRLVFVDQGKGFFEPREVLLGERSEDYYHVKSGLTNGERVVTSGNFLIDSESKLKASLSAFSGGHTH